MAESTPLTPEAAAVWAAFKDGTESGMVFAVGPSEGLTEALRELARLLARAGVDRRLHGPAMLDRRHVEREIIAIADSIDNAITYAEAPTDG